MGHLLFTEAGQEVEVHTDTNRRRENNFSRYHSSCHNCFNCLADY